MKMSISICIWALLLIILVSCGGVNLPSVEQSEKEIEFYKSQLKLLNRTVELNKPALPGDNDVVLNLKTRALNSLLKNLANNKKEDVILNFQPTRPLISEEKSILGISYRNYLDIDTGIVKLDLTKLRFIEFYGRKLRAEIEIKGKGKIKVSGKYTGIPAKSTPEISLYLKDTVSFELVPALAGSIMLTPNPKKLILKTRIKIKLLSWKIPWYQEIPIELTDLLDPVAIPAALDTDIKFPLLSSDKGGKGIEYTPYTLKFSSMSVTALKDIIEYRTNIELIK